MRKSARHKPTSQGPQPYHSSAAGDPTTLGETTRNKLNAADGDAEDDADGLIRTMMAMMWMKMTMMTMTVAPPPSTSSQTLNTC